ncbi:cytochrome P450 26A1-like [Glandiceps talaboti]
MLVLEGTVLSSVLLPMILPCVLLVLAFKLWSIYIENTRDMNCQAPLPDGSMGLPFIGETVQLVLQGAEFYRQKYMKHGRVFKTHIMGQPTIRAVGAENVRRILQGEGDIVTSHYPFTVRSVLGSHSIVISSGKEHDKIRKLVSKVFRVDYLARYVPYIQKYTQEAVQRWCIEREVLAGNEFRALVFRIVSKLLCGFDYDEKETRSLAMVFKEMVDNMFAFPLDIPGTRFNKAIRNRNILHEMIEANLRKEDDDDGDDDDGGFVDALRFVSNETDDNGDTMTTQQLKELALELLFAGHTTSASASTMMLLHLAENPDVVEKIRKELKHNELLEDDQQLTLETISKLKYVSSVVKEVLRISPPVGAGFRKVIKTFELEGKQIPAGWAVIFSIRETHNHATNFATVDKFDPDRFMPNRHEDKNGDRFNFIPFGGGARGCIGKQLALLMLKIFIVELVRGCRWQLVHPNNIKINLMPSPLPVDGLPVRFMQADCN